MHSLPIFLKLTGRPVILLGKGPAAEAKRRLLERAGAAIMDEQGDARLAIVAIDDDGQAQSAVARLKARGILVNATDRPALCDFTIPAIIDREPVLVAIGTSGASAGLAKALRIAIEMMLPTTLGRLAQALADARDRIRTRWPDAGDRRHAIDKALSPGGLLDPFSDADSATVAHWLNDAEDGPVSVTERIALRSADPDDLTLRDARLLGRADRIVHHPGIPDAILDRARADAVRISAIALPDDPLPGLTLMLDWED